MTAKPSTDDLDDEFLGKREMAQLVCAREA
jgi:hypothetical protein